MIGVIGSGSGSGRGGSNGAGRAGANGRGAGGGAGRAGAARFGVARRVALLRPLLFAAFFLFLRGALRAGFFLRAIFLREALRAGFFFRCEALRFDLFFATVAPPLKCKDGLGQF